MKLSNWGWYATGPCHGIQLKRGSQAGRLVVPCDHVTTNSLNGSHAIYSDDHGLTWQLGATVDSANNIKPNETACVELVSSAPNGGSQIYFNARESGSAAGTRGEAWSTNGGASFSGVYTNRASFVCPVVQGSLLRFQATDEGNSLNWLLFSCPNDASARINLSVWSSTNEATLWSNPKTVYFGPSAYSDLARTTAGDVVLLYEKGSASPYETISLARFNEAWLDSAATASEDPQPAFWNFEERAPGAAANTNLGAILDISPAALNNNLTAQKAFPYVLASTNFGSGAALAFDGTDGLQISDLATANHFDFGPTNSFTVEAVFRVPSGSTQTGALVAKDYGTLLPSWWLRVENGRLRFLVCDGIVENAATALAPLVNDGQWHHAAAVRDTRIVTTKILRLYLDGVLLTNVIDATTGSLANSEPLNIGRFGNSTSRNLTGDVDMVRITSKALAAPAFLGHWTQFDADGDLLPDSFERTTFGSLAVSGAGDSDGDGVDDLMEFATGTDALLPDSVSQISVTPSATSVLVKTQQRALPAWLELHLDSTDDLANWQPAAGTLVIMPQGSGIFLRSQTMLYPAGVPATLYFRTRLTYVP